MLSITDVFYFAGDFGYFKLGNGEKMKVEGIRSVRMKLHDDANHTFHNVRFVPFVVIDIISLGGWHFKDTSMMVQSWDARCTRGALGVARKQK